MMKKNYIVPSVETIILQGGQLLISVSGEGMNLGGTDDGSHDADARYYNDWDDDE